MNDEMGVLRENVQMYGELALELGKDLKARAQAGIKDATYYRDLKAAVVTFTGVVKGYAAIEHARTNDLVARRMDARLGGDPAQLPAGDAGLETDG